MMPSDMLDQMQENGGCTPRPSCNQRRLSDAMVEGAVLQDVSQARAAELGITFADTGYERDDEDENSMPALNRLCLVSHHVGLHSCQQHCM